MKRFLLPVVAMAAFGVAACVDSPTAFVAPDGPLFHHDFASGADVRVGDVEGSTVPVSWDQGRTHGANVPSGYRIELVEISCVGSSCQVPAGETTSGTDTEYTFPNVPDGAYQVRVRTADANNWDNALFSECFSVGAGSCAEVPAPQVTHLTDISGAGVYGGAATLTATLTDDSNNPIAGKTIGFRVNNLPVCGEDLPACPTTDDEGVAELSDVSLTGLNAGTYQNYVGATFINGPDYQGSSGKGPLTVDRAPLTITVVDAESNFYQESVYFGQPIPEHFVAFDGLVAGDEAADLGDVSYAYHSEGEGEEVTERPLPVGIYAVRPGVSSGDNYDITTVDGNLDILAWEIRGFFRPVNMDADWNIIQGGRTVPLQFQVFAGEEELSDPSAVKSLNAVWSVCGDTNASNSDVIDIGDETAGSTELRYDADSGHFIQNWQTRQTGPRSPSECYVVTLTTQDGSDIQAKFQTR
jgi:hypothetical protein